MVTCPNCGTNMQEKDRNCLRCGALNPYNPLNKELIRNLSQNRINTSFDRAHNIKDSTDAQKGFYIFNFIFLAIISFTCLEIASFSKISGLILFVIASIFFYEFICYQMIQLKAGNPWWVMYFPIVNIYYLLKLAFRKPIFEFLFVILPPLLGAVFYIVLPVAGTITWIISIILDIYIMIQFYFRLAEHFGRNRFAMIFFNMFIIPSIVLGDEEYIG